MAAKDALSESPSRAASSRFASAQESIGWDIFSIVQREATANAIAYSFKCETLTSIFAAPSFSSAARAASSSTARGAPSSSFSIDRLLSVIFPRSPVPSAFAIASFAANLAAKRRAASGRAAQYFISASVNVFFRKASPYCSSIFEMRATSAMSVPTPATPPASCKLAGIYKFPHFGDGAFRSHKKRARHDGVADVEFVEISRAE